MTNRIRLTVLALSVIVAGLWSPTLYGQDPKRDAGDKAGEPTEIAVRPSEAVEDFFDDDIDRYSVEEVQQALREMGYYVGPIDGIPGDRTRLSVKQFQRGEDLPATGRINAATLRQLHLEPVIPGAFVRARHPNMKPNATWATVGGSVVSPTPNSFMLDYGDGLLTVEMDDWDWYREAFGLIEGDPVIVRGRVDADPLERTSIEASSVYLKNLNTYFYASAADEEGLSAMIAPLDRWFQATGTVTSINGREFTLDTGAHEYTVDTITMPYNPLDDVGFQKIKQGDRVKASGKMDSSLFEDSELMAASIVTLTQDRGKAKKDSSN